MIAVVLCVLALVDAAFSGFRAFAGRDGRINKRQAKIEAAGVGVVAGLVALALLAVLFLGGIAAGWYSYDELTSAGRRMLVVYALFAALITVGFGAYFSNALEVRSLGTVLVLGPGTLFRPPVILAGALAAAIGSSAAIGAAAFVAAVVMLSVEAILNRRFSAQLAAHPFG